MPGRAYIPDEELLVELQAQSFGSLRLTGRIRRKATPRGHQHRYLQMRCIICGQLSWALLSSLRNRQVSDCFRCERGRRLT